QIVRAFPAFGALCFKVELKPVSSADGCGDDLPFQANWILKVNPLHGQLADVIRRESVLKQAACGSPGSKKAEQRQKQRSPLPTRPQHEQTSKQANSRASRKRAQHKPVGAPGTSQKYSQPKTGRH